MTSVTARVTSARRERRDRSMRPYQVRRAENAPCVTTRLRDYDVDFGTMLKPWGGTRSTTVPTILSASVWCWPSQTGQR